MSVIRSQIVGTGSYLPRRAVTNEELAKTVDTTDEWIRQRTGITQRYVAADDETTSFMGAEAAQAALAAAGLKPSDLDLIILATTTPDRVFPASAVQIQALIGASHAVAFDMQAVCSGFVFALTIADKFLISGQYKTALVVGADRFSRILDWQDRATCVLFGDGAGAVILRAASGTGTAADRAILSSHLYSDGNYEKILYVDEGLASDTRGMGHVRMEGREVFRHAVAKMAQAIDKAIEETGITPADIDWMVPHQANRRIIEAMAERLNLPLSKVVITVDRHANTSAASIPLALAEAVKDGRIQQGQLLLLEAMGGGLTWGSVLIRY